MRVRPAALTVLFAAFFIASSEAQAPKSQKNLFQNGDFSDGVAHWKGSGKAEIFQEESAETQKGGSRPEAAKSLATTEKPPTPPPLGASTTVPPRPPFGAAPAKAGAGVDRSYCVTLGSRPQNFYQSVSVPRTAKLLRMSFRVRAGAGYMTSRTALGAFRVSIERPDETKDYDDEKLETKSGWRTITKEFGIRENSRSVNLKIEVYPGAGQMYFDDFVVEAT